MPYRKIDLNSIGGDKGKLVALESMSECVPFDIKRVYYLYGVPNGVNRGFHAHKALKQLLICVSGSFRLVVDDGVNREEIEMNSPGFGLLIEPCVWREMHEMKEGDVLMVLADEYYKESDYIRDYDEFRSYLKLK